MPYHLEKVGRKYKVITTETGVAHSKEPMTKKKAEAQLRILNRHTDVVQHLGGSVADKINHYIGNMSTMDKVEAGLSLTGVGNAFTLARIAWGILHPNSGVDYSIPIISKEDLENRFSAIKEENKNQLILDQLIFKEKNIQKMNDLKFNRFNDNGGPAASQPQTEEEWAAAMANIQKNADTESRAREFYDQGRQQIAAQANADRETKKLQAIQQQNQQHLSGLNQSSLAAQAQITNVKESLAKAKILQQQRKTDQQLFLTKANDIRRKDFFDQERIAGEARKTLIEAEQRRQAIKAAAQQQVLAASQPTSSAPQMVPTLGRRLPPSIPFNR